jgi:hypothetical protein
LKHLVACTVRVQGGAVQQGSQTLILVLARQNIQLFVRAVPIAGKAQHLEQKSAAMSVCRVVPQFHTHRLDGIVESAGFEKFP